MTTFNPNIENIFNERFAPSDDTSDFLGMCFGSGRCKRRRDERRKAREEKRRLRGDVIRAKADGIRTGTYQGSGSGLLDTIGSIASNIFGGGGSPEPAPQTYVDAPASQPAMPVEPAKKSNTIIYIVIGIVIVAGFAFYALKKSKK